MGRARPRAVSSRTQDPSCRRGSWPSTRALLAFLESTIDEDPALYLAYILFAEYLVVLLGPEWLTLLEERCGIPRSSMTVIGNHVELDKEHVEEALAHIDDLVSDPRKLSRMREVLLQTIEHFERFCDEVTGPAACRTPPRFCCLTAGRRRPRLEDVIVADGVTLHRAGVSAVGSHR